MPPNHLRLWPDSEILLDRSRGVFLSQWEELLRLRRVVIKTSDQDDIHDLRVASRRFRAALDLFYPFLPKGSKTELRKSVRKLTRVLGGLRNIDEAKLFFLSRSKTDISADKKLLHHLDVLRSRELREIEKALTSFDHRHLDRIVRKMFATLKDDSVSGRASISILAYFSEVSIRLFLQIHQLLVVSTAPGHRNSRHALRIAIKKWRYFFEIIAPILGREYSHILELLREYQSILGRMNDIAVFELLSCDLGLPPNEREYVKMTLQVEDALLLKNFTELVERKPLTYTFLI
jgi:CHAD domain-containing protein